MKTTKEVSTDALASARRDGGDTPTVKIKAIITLHINGEDHAPGAVVDIVDDEAKRLITRGFATAHGQDKAAAATPAASGSQKTETPPAGGGGKPAPTIEDIVEAIAALDPAKDYGKNGKPNVDAIETVLGTNISAAQRDQAWEAFQKEKEEDGKEE